MFGEQRNTHPQGSLVRLSTESASVSIRPFAGRQFELPGSRFGGGRVPFPRPALTGAPWG